MTVVYIVLTLSIAIQIVAAYLALRLIPVTGGRRAWILVSTAIFLMIVRRCFTLFELLQKGSAYQFDPTLGRMEEWISLITSVIMVAGIAMIAPLFDSIKRSAEAVKESEEKYRTLFEESRDAIYITNGEGRLLDVNRSTLDLFGYLKDEMLGLDARTLYVDSFERSRLREELRARGYARDHEMRLRKKSGEIMRCILTATVRRTADGVVQGYQGMVRDITRRTQMEEALRESEERYRSFFEESLTGVYISTPDGNLLACNPAFARIFGFESVEGAVKCNVQTLYHDPASHQSFVELIRSRKKLEYHQRELRRHDGKLLHVIENTIGKFNKAGELTEIKGYVFDNTELRNLEEQLLHSQKMEAIGRLAGGIAHDFNNLLTAITGYTDLMLMKIPEGDPLHFKAEEIKKAADRAATLTRQLLAFSRKQVLQPKVLDLNAVIFEMEKMLRRLIGEDIELRTLLDPEIGHVKTDPGQIEQVIMNLAVNARDAMPEGGRLTIETANVELDEAYARQHVALLPGQYVMLAVSDTGLGMDAETLSRVFEPFFTTKEKDKGTGLGLATVYGIVKQSGGHIWVYSEVERGTTFKIYLPRIMEETCHVQTDGGPTECLEGSETILLVEDDEMVRSIISESLRLNGYTVLVAHQGDEAERICRQYGGSIHIMVTDVVMPGMNGRELAERLSVDRPEMKILFMSGYTDKGIVQNGVLEPGTAYLQKPFRLEALLHKIREVLKKGDL